MPDLPKPEVRTSTHVEQIATEHLAEAEVQPWGDGPLEEQPYAVKYAEQQIRHGWRLLLNHKRGYAAWVRGTSRLSCSMNVANASAAYLERIDQGTYVEKIGSPSGRPIEEPNQESIGTPNSTMKPTPAPSPSSSTPTSTPQRQSPNAMSTQSSSSTNETPTKDTAKFPISGIIEKYPWMAECRDDIYQAGYQGKLQRSKVGRSWHYHDDSTLFQFCQQLKPKDWKPETLRPQQATEALEPPKAVEAENSATEKPTAEDSATASKATDAPAVKPAAEEPAAEEPTMEEPAADRLRPLGEPITMTVQAKHVTFGNTLMDLLAPSERRLIEPKLARAESLTDLLRRVFSEGISDANSTCHLLDIIAADLSDAQDALRSRKTGTTNRLD